MHGRGKSTVLCSCRPCNGPRRCPSWLRGGRRRGDRYRANSILRVPRHLSGRSDHELYGAGQGAGAINPHLWTAEAVSGAFLAPIIGCRGLFLVGPTPALLVLMIRYWVPESPRWLMR